jgi:hypothetical protein
VRNRVPNFFAIVMHRPKNTIEFFTHRIGIVGKEEADLLRNQFLSNLESIEIKTYTTQRYIKKNQPNPHPEMAILTEQRNE